MSTASNNSNTNNNTIYTPEVLRRIVDYLNRSAGNPASPYHIGRVGSSWVALKIAALAVLQYDTTQGVAASGRERLRDAWDKLTTTRMMRATPMPTDQVHCDTYHTPTAKKLRKSFSAQLAGYLPKIKNVNSCASFMYDLRKLWLSARVKQVQVPALYDVVSAYSDRLNSGRREYLHDSQWIRGYEELARALAVYVSEDDPSKVAYYPTVRAILDDRPLRTTLAKWLTKYRNHPKVSAALTDAEIKRRHEQYVARHAGLDADSVEFATTPEDWEWVYENGPSSCMRGESAVRVYCREGNHLRLAFWRNPEDEDSVVARAIVREDTKEFVRVYPNPDKEDDRLMHNKFRAVLESLGYEHGNLNGIKLIYEEADYGDIVCPYIDCGNGGAQSVDIGYDRLGQYLVVTPSGGYEATNTNGLLEINSHTCDHCGDRVDEDDTTYVEGYGSVCSSCLDCDFVLVYSSTRYMDTQDYVHDQSDYIRAADDKYFLNSDVAHAHDYAVCANDDEWYPLGDLIRCTAGSYEDELVHHSQVVTTVDDEQVFEGDATSTDDGWVLDDDVRYCFIRNEPRHEKYMIEVELSDRTVHIDPGVFEDELASAFDVVVDDDTYRLVLKGQGQPITDDLRQQMHDHGVANITEGDEASSHLLF